MEGQQFNITDGNDGSITCTATGYPLPTVVWQNSDGSSLSNSRLVSGSPVISSTGIGNLDSVSVELMVIGALRVDTGMYRCSANNVISNAAKNIIITIQCKCVSFFKHVHDYSEANTYFLICHFSALQYLSQNGCSNCL